MCIFANCPVFGNLMKVMSRENAPKVVMPRFSVYWTNTNILRRGGILGTASAVPLLSSHTNYFFIYEIFCG